MNIAILTMFNGLNESYSVVSAVKNQIQMLLQNGHRVTMLVSEHCPDEERTGIFADDRIAWVKITNSLNGKRAQWTDYTRYQGNVSPDFWTLAEAVAKDLEAALCEVDLCILHDILYQGLHLVHNAAVRAVQKSLPKLRFLAFAHSVPREHQEQEIPYRFMYCDMPNTTFVCPSQAMISLLANQYDICPRAVAVVPTAIDLIDGMSEEVKQIFSVRDFYKPEFIMVYPARAASSKGHNLLAHFAGELKRISGESVLIIFADSYGDKNSRSLMRFELQRSGIAEEEFLFTSELGFEQGIPHKAVLELFSLSNLFVFPSLAETQGLVALEAASRGNFLVMHSGTPALYELGQMLQAALYYFGGNALPAQPQNGESSIQIIIRQMRENPVIQAKNTVRRSFSPKEIYSGYLSPLLYN
ncbi:MAG: glycosyltransferase [Hydrogenoanaerobacterium sp.]